MCFSLLSFSFWTTATLICWWVLRPCPCWQSGTVWKCISALYIYIYYIILYYIRLYYIMLCYVILYPPTPAICRGSAPEKKWLCGVMKGQALNECQHHVHQALAIFFWFQKATLGSRLALNVSRRPRLPLNPSRPPTPAIWRGSAPENKWLCGVMKGQA